ncbi:MAG: T9SS type A sorting domain-containing protein, partial [Bacteroidia bacterium]|nr:T9SS type A sorting domain-containing protein [Bacteroidia bacterium]
GDTLEFAVDGVIFLQSEITFSNNLTLIAPEAGNLVISGSGQNRLFQVGKTDTVSFFYMTFRNGYAAGFNNEGGGAIKNRGTVYATGCLFLNNQGEVGGAIENVGFGADTSALYLDRCSFIGNKASKVTTISPSVPRGGAIFSDSRQYGRTRVTAINCTFSGNEAELSGGAIYQLDIPFGTSESSFANCTFTKNGTPDGCGGVDYDQGRIPKMSGCIIAGNLGRSSYPNIRGKVNSNDFNLFEDTLSLSFSGGIGANDLIGVDPLLIALAEFGPRSWMHALSCQSPCLNVGMAGNGPLLDQRGSPRIGLADVGAYERNESTDLGMFNVKDNGVGSLRFLIAFHCLGDTIFVPALLDTIFFEKPIRVSERIVIFNSAERPVVLHGNDSTRIFEIAANGQLSLKGFDIVHAQGGNYGGGAILNEGQLSVDGCTFAFNQASAGGAIANYAKKGTTSFCQIINSTFSNNVATWLDGGAIDSRSFDDSSATMVDITASTFAFNQAYVRGGAIYQDDEGVLTLDHCLIDRNLAPIGEQVFGSLNSGGNNLFRNPEGIVCDFADSDIIDVPSNIFSLDNYGGPTLTHALPEYSIAVDAGTVGTPTSITDQRGLLRKFGEKQDIGSVEFQGLVSISKEVTENKVTVYPNPGSSFFLTFDKSYGPLLIIMYNDAGQEVWRENIDNTESQGVAFAPRLPSGIYYTTITGQYFRESLRLVIK